MANRFAKDPPQDQDIRQVWFAGVHSDIGGGYPEAESGLAKFSMAWMIEQAVEHGLKINDAMKSSSSLWASPGMGGKWRYVETNELSCRCIRFSESGFGNRRRGSANAVKWRSGTEQRSWAHSSPTRRAPPDQERPGNSGPASFGD